MPDVASSSVGAGDGLPSPGDVVAGKYRIERVLGKGGMGIVLAAHHELLGQSVALKLLLPEIAKSGDSVARFINEGRAAARLENAHVARVMDVGMLDGGLPFLVMELLSGNDLDEILAREGPMPTAAVVDYLLQAIEAVAEAHSIGIVHRDLKPSNLFLAQRKDGPIVKVLDFGISKVASDGGNASITTTNSVLGSPGYMSPEQLRNAKEIDARADIWSLGVIAYELLTGTLPFDGPNVVAIFAAIQETNPPSISLRCPGAPPAVAAAVHRCLERSLERRFANVTDLAIELAPYGTATAHASLAQIRKTLPESPRPVALARTLDPTSQPSTQFNLPVFGQHGAAHRPSDPNVMRASSLPSFVAPTMQAPPRAPTPVPALPQAELGLPAIDRIRTTAGMSMHPAGVPKKGRGVAVVAVCGLVGIGGGLVFALKGTGTEGVVTAASDQSPAHSLPASADRSRLAPSVAATSTPEATENRWIRVNPPPSPLALGVPDGTPAVVRGIRAARHFVAPSVPFEIQQHEVTWGEAAAWLAKNPAYHPGDAPGLPGEGAARKLYPLTGVSWDAAREYCRSIGGGLPREDEWEYAARGPKLRKFPWGADALDLQRTNAFGAGSARLRPVMTSDQDQTPEPEATAIFDLMGNAREWTADLYRDDELPKSSADEAWVQSGGMSWRAVRGLPLDEKAKGFDNYGATYRSQLCGSGPCPKGTEQLRQFVGFRCVRHALSP